MQKLNNKFLCMTVACTGYSSSNDLDGICVMNDGSVIRLDIIDGSVRGEIKGKSKPSDVEKLFQNVQKILRNDKSDRKLVISSTQYVGFYIFYSKNHVEECSPFMINDKGQTIISLMVEYLEKHSNDAF